MFGKWGTKCEASFKINECASCFCFNPLTRPSSGMPHTSLVTAHPSCHRPSSVSPSYLMLSIRLMHRIRPSFLVTWISSFLISRAPLVPHPRSSPSRDLTLLGPFPHISCLIIILHLRAASLPHTVPKNMTRCVWFDIVFVPCFCRPFCCLSWSCLQWSSVLLFCFCFFLLLL